MLDWLKAIPDWIERYSVTVTLCTALIGGAFTAWKFLQEWRKQNSIRRAEWVEKLIKEMRCDEDNKRIRYKIEYSEIKYYKGKGYNFHGNEAIESSIDKYLSLLNFICYLRKTRAINRKDFNTFRYSVVWALTNKNKLGDNAVQAYLWNLYHFAKLTSGPPYGWGFFYLKNRAPCSFHYLICWGLFHRLFVPDFKSPYCKSFTNPNRSMDCQNIEKRAKNAKIYRPRRLK